MATNRLATNRLATHRIATHRGEPCFPSMLWALALGICAFGFWVGAAAASANASRIEGRALTADGLALAKAEVQLIPLISSSELGFRYWRGEESEPVAKTQTGKDGSYDLTAPDIGFWQIRIVKEGYESQAYDLIPVTEDVTLPDAAVPIAKEVKLHLTHEGAGIAGARLLVRRDKAELRGWRSPSAGGGGDQWEAPVWSGRTDAQGRATLVLSDPSEWTLEAVAEGFLPVSKSLRRVGSGLELVAGTPRAIQVLAPRGSSVEGTIVRLEEHDLPIAASDEEGLAWVVLGKGEHEISLRSPDGATGRLSLPAQDAEAAQQGESQEARPLKVEIDHPPRLEGRVLTAGDRQPVGHAVVWTLDRYLPLMTRSDAMGNYALEAPRESQFGIGAGSQGAMHTVAMVQVRADREIEGPTLLLAPAASLLGVVVDAEGNPLAEVEARLIPGPTQGGFSFKAMMAGREVQRRSDSDGRLAFRGLPTQRGFNLHLARSGFAPVEAEIDALADYEVRRAQRWQMAPGQRGFGYVVDPQDQPIVGAEVRLVSSDPVSRRRGVTFNSNPKPGDEPVITDGEGYFEAPDLASGRYDLEASASGFSKGQARGIEIPEGVGELDLGVLVLGPGIDLEGRVVDPTGQGVEGAQIFAYGANDRSWRYQMASGQAEPTALTDREGRFVVADKTAGDQLEVLASKEGYVSEMARSVTLPSDDEVRIVLQAASGIEGRVVDADGVPLEGVGVRALPEDKAARRSHSVLQASVLSAPDGRFEIPSVRPGLTTIHAQLAGYKPLQLSGFEVPAEDLLRGVELQLTVGAELTGTLTDRVGDPVAGVIVTVWRTGMQIVDGGYAQSDGDGRFQFSGLPLGAMTVQAQGEGMQKASRNVTIIAGSNTVDLQFAGGVSVSGQVTDDQGRPLQGARIDLRTTQRAMFMGGRGTVESLADGSFLIEDVPAGSYRVSASKDGYGSHPLKEPLEVADTPVAGLNFQLGGGRKIVGRILGLEFEELGRTRVSAYGGGAEVTQPDFEGRFEVNHVRPGFVNLKAEVLGTSRSVSQSVTIEEHEFEKVVDLEFIDGFVLTGSVFKTGEAAPGVTLYLLAKDGSSSASATTSAEGTFRFEGLKEGPHSLRLGSWQTTYHYNQDIEITGDDDVRIDLEVARLSGQVIDEDGNAVSDTRLTLHIEDQRRQSASSDSGGRFDFGEIAVGNWRLDAQSSGYGHFSAEVDLQAGDVIDAYEVRLTAARGLILNVRLPSGQPASVIDLALTSAFGQPAGGTFQGDDQGEFIVDTVPDGIWQMVLASEGQATVVHHLVVPMEDPLRLQLEPEARLVVVVPELAEDSTVGATMQLFSANGQAFVRVIRGSSRTDDVYALSRGRRTMRGLTRGLWRVTVTADDGRVWNGQVTVTAGQTETLELQ